MASYERPDRYLRRSPSPRAKRSDDRRERSRDRDDGERDHKRRREEEDRDRDRDRYGERTRDRDSGREKDRGRERDRSRDRKKDKDSKSSKLVCSSGPFCCIALLIILSSITTGPQSRVRRLLKEWLARRSERLKRPPTPLCYYPRTLDWLQPKSRSTLLPTTLSTMPTWPISLCGVRNERRSVNWVSLLRKLE